MSHTKPPQAQNKHRLSLKWAMFGDFGFASWRRKFISLFRRRISNRNAARDEPPQTCTGTRKTQVLNLKARQTCTGTKKHKFWTSKCTKPAQGQKKTKVLNFKARHTCTGKTQVLNFKVHQTCTGTKKAKKKNNYFTSNDPHHGISKQANPPYLFSGILCDLAVSCPLLIIAPVTSVWRSRPQTCQLTTWAFSDNQHAKTCQYTTWQKRLSKQDINMAVDHLKHFRKSNLPKHVSRPPVRSAWANKTKT